MPHRPHHRRYSEKTEELVMDPTLAEMKVEKMMMKPAFKIKVCLETCRSNARTTVGAVAFAYIGELVAD